MARKSDKRNKLQLEWGKVIIPPTVTVIGSIIVAILGCAGTIIAALVALGSPLINRPRSTETPIIVSLSTPPETIVVTDQPTVQLPTATKPAPMFIQEWEGDYFVNYSTYGCVYAWPKNESHEVSGNVSSLYYQENTWSVHPMKGNYYNSSGNYIPDIKPASPSYVLLSTEPILLKQVLLHLVSYKPAPNLEDFTFIRLKDLRVCNVGGFESPRLAFENLAISPSDTTLFPNISTRVNIADYSVISLPYQMNANESLSFEVSLDFSTSGIYILKYSVLFSDFEGIEYEVYSPEIAIRRLIINDDEFRNLSIIER